MEEVKRTKKRSLWVDIWKRFRKNRVGMIGMAIILILIFTAIFADVLAPEAMDAQNLSRLEEAPSRGSPMGRDNFGRDILSRIIFGARTSMMIGGVVVSISMVAGVAIGIIAGYLGGKMDNILMRIMDILLALPGILLAVTIAAALGPSLVNVMIAVGIGAIPGYARLVRASALTLREQEFVEAARACGASDFRIMFKHILPNSMAPIIVQATLGLAGAILSAAGLGFIGLGIQPPLAEWGSMLTVGRRFILSGDWHIAVFPGLAIVIVVLAFNMMGDGLRDALDPKLKR